MRYPTPALLLAAAALISPAIAQAADCAPVNTTIVTSFYVDGCQSPFGLCTRGAIPRGPLRGTTQFQVLTLGPGPTATTLLYTGVLTVTTASGTLTLHDRGLLDQATGRFFELESVVSGTGSFLNATGWLTSQGFDVGTGFSGTLTGAVCRADDRSE